MSFERRYGHPRTEQERRARHFQRYDSTVLPPRGTGLFGLGEDWEAESEKYYSKSDAELAAQDIADQGYQTKIEKKFIKKWSAVYKSEKKGNVQRKRDEYKEQGYQTKIEGYTPSPFAKKKWRLKVQKPYWLIKKKKLTRTQLKTKEKAKEQEIELKQAEAEKAMAETPWGQILKWFRSIGIPIALPSFKDEEDEPFDGELFNDDEIYGDELV